MENYLNIAKSWVIEKFKDRKTYDGGMLIATGGSYLLLNPLAEVIAYAAVAYGVWLLWKKESAKKDEEVPK